MKLKISLLSARRVLLPKEFNNITQALIYHLLDRLPAEWLHNNGFKVDNRSFKLFTFSSIIERAVFQPARQIFTFPNEISFYISSPVPWILEQIAKNIIANENVMLGKNKMSISSVEIIKDEDIKSDKIRVNALTPIEVHSTLTKGDGAKKTYYYSPSETEYSELINANLKKKWIACYREECRFNIKIAPVKMKYCRERIRCFNGTVIKGWTGHFWLEGEPEFLRFALTAGLGSRNSAGFGFVEAVRKR
ncbi:MAG: CRISPR-associated endoribonuclease Cas6 [Candidatus Anammoxibacter sp.]